MSHRSARRVRRKLLVSVAVVGVLAATMSLVVFSSFTSATRNAGSTFQSGSIELTSTSQGSALFAMAGSKPGDSQSRCVRVSYRSSGALTSGVRLYGTTSSSQPAGGLARFLDVTVTRGSFPQGAPDDASSCAGFAADTSAATLYSGRLSAFPTSYDAGRVDPNPAWSNGQSAVYRIQVTLADEDAAQGLDATQQFVWEARNT